MSSAETLRSKEQLLGFWSVTGDPAVIDTAASVAPDFVVVDTQHGLDLGRVDSSLFTVLASYGVPGLVRVESIDVAPIGRALDLGAAGIIVPLVESADDAERAVAATRHAPEGGRSYGMQTRRVGPFDERPFVVIQVETAGAVSDIESIAAVEGVDALYIGPADLGLALGGVPAPNVDTVFDGSHENADTLVSAFDAVVEAARANDVRPGLHVHNGAAGARAREHGFRMSSVATDVGLVGFGLGRELETARDA
jgi:4-hydroxy-2-oxoheptanedioate aldolase